MKKAIEMKNSIQEALKKFETLNIKIEEEKKDEKSDQDQKPGTSKSRITETTATNSFISDNQNDHDSYDISDGEQNRKKRKIEMLKVLKSLFFKTGL